MKAKIIAIANHKGGVGKTTTASSLGSILAKKGYRVLLIDLDAQANLTTSLVGNVEGGTIYDVLTGRQEHLPVVELTETLHLVPASLNLAMADIELSSAIAREKILTEALKKEKTDDRYDFILLDCPPSLGLITLNAFTACTDIIIPLICEVLPFVGLTMISDFTAMVEKRLNPHCHITGILITRWESSKLSRNIEKSSERYCKRRSSRQRYARTSVLPKRHWRSETSWSMTRIVTEPRTTQPLPMSF